MTEPPAARPVLPTEMERFVTLREFEQRMQTIQAHWAQNITAQRELLDVRAESLDTALKLQAKEYERRLDDLNHAHAAAVQESHRVVPREMFEQRDAEWAKWRDDVNAKLTGLTSVNARMDGTDNRVRLLENSAQHILGAMTLVRFMGFAGVMALLTVIARMVLGVP